MEDTNTWDCSPEELEAKAQRAAAQIVSEFNVGRQPGTEGNFISEEVVDIDENVGPALDWQTLDGCPLPPFSLLTPEERASGWEGPDFDAFLELADLSSNQEPTAHQSAVEAPIAAHTGEPIVGCDVPGCNETLADKQPRGTGCWSPTGKWLCSPHGRSFQECLSRVYPIWLARSAASLQLGTPSVVLH